MSSWTTRSATRWLYRPAWLLVAVLGCDTVGSGSLLGEATVHWQSTDTAGWTDDDTGEASSEILAVEIEAPVEIESPVENTPEEITIPVDPDDCQGAVKVSTSPSGDMVVCDDVDDRTCEQDMEQLCPVGWGLCSQPQYVERNAGWSYPVGGATVVVGEIYDRRAGGAGHFTLGPFDDPGTLGADIPLNCAYGSDRGENGVTPIGCNERTVQALCCAPSASCGNGVVDSPEEQCDDGNDDDGDGCLRSCAWSAPTGHGLDGRGC